MDKQLLFSAKNIEKTYAGTKALKGVDLDVYENEVIGLVGENGAGKSTLLNIIIGLQSPTSGEMTFHGEKYSPRSPKDANDLGVGMVFQEQSMITNLSVGQNVFLGREKEFSTGKLIHWNKMYSEAQQVLQSIGCPDIPVKKKLYDLDFATRQMIEIAKVISIVRSSGSQKCLILLDEPTSVLNDEEVQRLYKVIRDLKAMGHSVIFVSHRLKEVLEISDRIFVYKNGASVGDMTIAEASEKKLYEMMVGRTASSEYYKLDKEREPEKEVVLEVKNLGMTGVFSNVSFQLHKGEILGLAGVVGSGIEEICSALCGDEKQTRGEIYLGNKKVNLDSPSDALKHGLLMIPKERLSEGIVDVLSVAENIALSNESKYKNKVFLSRKKLDCQADKCISDLNIKTTGKDEQIVQLSGGNQQKVVFSRAMESECQVLILNHPTRGVDVGAKEEIYSLIRDMANAGKSFILLGDTLEECIGMSNRIIVVKDGLVVGEFTASASIKPTQVDIVSLMM